MKDKRKLYAENGEPRYIRCYETKRNPTQDRYTVVFGRASCWAGEAYRGMVCYVGMSANSCHPTGIYCHGEADARRFCPCGSRIPFSQLPKDGQELVRQEYASNWRVRYE